MNISLKGIFKMSPKQISDCFSSLFFHCNKIEHLAALKILLKYNKLSSHFMQYFVGYEVALVCRTIKSRQGCKVRINTTIPLPLPCICAVYESKQPKQVKLVPCCFAACQFILYFACRCGELHNNQRLKTSLAR